MVDNNSFKSAMSTLIWAVIWGTLTFFTMGMTSAAFGYGFIMSVIAGLLIFVTLIPFIGVFWYASLFDWISGSLLVTLGLKAGIITTIMFWLGILGGIFIGGFIVILLIAILVGR